MTFHEEMEKRKEMENEKKKKKNEGKGETAYGRVGGKEEQKA